MHALSTPEFFAAAETSASNFGAQTNRRETALAFGVTRKPAGSRWLDLDAVAMILVDEMAPAFTRRYAAGIVNGNSYAWLAAVGEADSRGEPIYLTIGETGKPIRRGGPLEKAAVGYGTMAELFESAAHAKGGGTRYSRIHLYDITAILTRVRANAAKVGVDLSDPLFPPPNHPAAKRLLKQAKKDRDRVLEMYAREKLEARTET